MFSTKRKRERWVLLSLLEQFPASALETCTSFCSCMYLTASLSLSVDYREKVLIAPFADKTFRLLSWDDMHYNVQSKLPRQDVLKK